MNNNIFKYLTKYGNKSFEKLKFNELDAAIFAQIAYIRFEKVYKKYPLKLKVITKAFLKFEKEIRKKYVVYDIDLQFIRLLDKSKRFSELMILDSYTYFNILNETQVFAYTMKVSDDENILVFRGTDETILGWKEALKLGYDPKCIGHDKSKKYFINMLNKYPDVKYYIAGHSKGGNFAIYAASSVPVRYEDRIKAVYNFDGPNILDPVKKKTLYDLRNKKIITYLPKASVVGAVIEQGDNVKVVDSDLFSLFQHVIYYWKINDKSFKIAKRRTIFSSIFERSFRRWLFEIPYPVADRVVSTLFLWADKANIKNIDDFADVRNTGEFLSKLMSHIGKHKKSYHKYVKKFIEIYISESIKKDRRQNK